MKKIKIGEKELGLKASPLALFYYQQEFGKDLTEDLVSLQEMQNISESDFSGFDSIKLLQIIYAMNKANNFGKKDFPDFENWLDELDHIDLADPDFMLDAFDEAMEGFFRSVNGEYQEKTEQTREQLEEQKSKEG